MNALSKRALMGFAATLVLLPGCDSGLSDEQKVVKDLAGSWGIFQGGSVVQDVTFHGDARYEMSTSYVTRASAGKIEVSALPSDKFRIVYQPESGIELPADVGRLSNPNTLALQADTAGAPVRWYARATM